MKNQTRVIMFTTLLLLISGCNFISSMQEKIPGEVSAREYDIKIKSIETTYNCVGLFEQKTCSIINLEITSKASESISLALNEYAIVLGDGTQFGLYTGAMGFGGGLPDRCYIPLEKGISLFPNAKQSISLCFPEIKRESSPMLYLGFLYNYQEEYGEALFDIKRTGEQRRHTFNITPFLESQQNKKYKLSIVIDSNSIKIKNDGNSKEGVILNFFVEYFRRTSSGYEEKNASYNTPALYNKIREVDANSEVDISLRDCIPTKFESGFYSCELTLFNANEDQKLDNKTIAVYYESTMSSEKYEIVNDTYDEIRAYLKENNKLVE